MIDPLIELNNPNQLKFTIPFTQYLRPDGRKRRVFFDVLGDVAEQSKAIIDRGWLFEVEELTTGEVSLTVFDPESQVNVSIEVVRNGPEVVSAIDRLVLISYNVLLEEE